MNKIAKFLTAFKKSDKKILQHIVENPTPKAILLLLGIVFGVLVAAQWQSLPTRVTDPLAPYTSLKETRDTLSTEQDQLKAAIQNNKNQLDALQAAASDIGNNKGNLADLENQKKASGLTNLKGPGILVVLNDSKQSPVTDDSIIHASDLRDTVNLLWGAGAEAISINDERIVTTSSIDCIVNTILINNTRLTVPFTVRAIGDPRILLSQMRNRDNLSNLYQRRDQNGLIVDISQDNNLIIKAFSGGFDLQTALK